MEHRATGLYSLAYLSAGVHKQGIRFRLVSLWQECLPYQECLSLPDAVAVCTFRGNAPERGKSDENRYILRNKANKSFRINTNAWEEVQKATRKRNEIR